MIKTSKQILAMNLKYYRKLLNLSQEKFAEGIGSNLVYLNQMENCKRKPTIDMLDKIATGITKMIQDNKKDIKEQLDDYTITSALLLTYNDSHKTNFNRIDEKK